MMEGFDITDDSNDSVLFGTPDSAASDKPFDITDNSADEELFGRKYETKPAVLPKPKGLLRRLADDYNSRDAVNARADLGDKVFGGLERVAHGIVALPSMFQAGEQARSARWIQEAGEQPDATPEQKAQAERSKQVYQPEAVRDYFDAVVKQEDADAKTPLSLERQVLNKELAGAHSFIDTAKVIVDHPQAFGEQALEGLAPYMPLSVLGPLAAPAGAGLMGVQEKAEGMKKYLASKGVDYHDKAARDAYLADPQHMDEAEHYGDIHAAAMVGAMVAAGGLVKAGNVGLDAVNVAGKARTAASIPLHIGANAVPFVGATHAANAALGEETSGSEDAQSLAMAVGFGAHGAFKEHGARVKADKEYADKIAAASLENTLGHVKAKNDQDRAVVGEFDKHVTNLELDKKAAADKAAQEKAKNDAFAQREQEQTQQDQQTADEKEAGLRTNSLENQFRGQSRVVGSGTGNVERVPVHPPAEVTPEQVKAEREQAAADEADRLDRAELGGLTEHVRKRQDLIAKRAADANMAAEKKARTAASARKRKITDQLIAENPDMAPHELAPLLRERLKEPVTAEAPKEAAPEKPVQEATATPTEDVKEPLTANVSKPDSELSDKEVENLSRDAGMYVPEGTMNMAAGAKATPKKDFVDNVHKIVKGLVAKSGNASRSVQHLLLQKKIVLAPNAESIGRSDTGVGSFDRKTGKMYIYTDHLKDGDVAGTIVAALHESTHLGQFNDRTGRSSIMQHMMSKDRENAASKKIRAAADAGNKLAVQAVKDATAAHPDTRVQDLELTPYFVGAVAEHRNGSTLGRVGGVANDILSAGRSFVKDKLGVDLDLTMGDLHSAAMKVGAEAVKTEPRPDAKGGSFDMIAGRHAAGIHKAEQEGRIYKGHVDHMDRFEIPDEHAELANPKVPEEKRHYDDLIARRDVPLKDILKHDELYKNYPELANVKVRMEDLDDAQGRYDMRKNVITVDRNTLLNALSSPKSSEELRNLFLHETQHAVQSIEGFVPGNSAKYFIPKSLTRQYKDAKSRMESLVDGFELGKALKGMSFEDRKGWEALVKWAHPRTLSETAAYFLHNDFGARSSDRAVVRYNQQYRDAVNEYNTINTEHEKARTEAYKTYLRDYGETEARNTEFRSRMSKAERDTMTPEESMEFATGGVPVERTLNTAQYAGGKGVPESHGEDVKSLPDVFNMAFRKKGEGEFSKGTQHYLADYVDGRDRTANDAPPTQFHWATKAVKTYLSKYAGTPEDPLADVVLPSGRTWGEVIDGRVDTYTHDEKTKPFTPLDHDLATEDQVRQYRAKHYNKLKKALDIPADKNPAIHDLRDPHEISEFLAHVGDYLLTEVPEHKLAQYDLVRAVKETVAHDEAAKKKMATARAKSAANMPVHKDYGDGFKWVQLTKPGEFAQESDVMGHSVRGYEPPQRQHSGPGVDHFDWDTPHPDWVPESGDSGHSEYGHGGWEGIKSGKAKIYSLRGPDGMSHVTVEARATTKYDLDDPYSGTHDYAKATGKKSGSMVDGYYSSMEPSEDFLAWRKVQPPELDITQIKGKQNAKPSEKYLPYVQDFVKNGKWESVSDLHNTGLIEDQNNPGKYITEEELKPYIRPLLSKNDFHTNGDVEAAFRKKKIADDLPDTFNMAGKEDTPEFKKWFGDSVAKEEDGTPRRFYTGTSKDVDFKAFKVPRNGTWFTSDPKHASDYALDNDSKGTVWDREKGPWATKEVNTASRVFPVYLKAEKPYVATDADFTRMNKGNYKKAQSELFDELRKQGYDSVIMDGTKDDPKTVVILNEPTQIKSVNNKGTWSDKLPDVLNMASKADTPRTVGETEKAWEDRIAKKNGSVLNKALKAVFGVNETKELGRQMMVGNWAAQDRAFTTIERTFHGYKVMFDKMKKADVLETIDQWETGKKVDNPEAEAFFKALNPAYKTAIDYIRSVDPKLLKELNERYLAHVWEKSLNDHAVFLTKGPLAGSKSFLKARMHKTIKEGMAAGLKPKTTNPAELSMIKLAELQKFAGLLSMREELRNRGWLVKHEVGKRVPEGWGTVNDPSFLGHMIPDVIAHDLNNYLSRGLSDVPGFRQIRYLENLMVAGKLGWSGFHAGFTTMDNMVTHSEVALRRGLHGDIKGALVGVMKAVTSPVHSPYEGGALNKLFLGHEPTEGEAKRWEGMAGVDEHTKALLDLVEKGGGRAYMDPSEWNAGIQKEIQAFRQRDIKQGLKSALPAIADASGWVIHRKLVPAQKAAARVLMLKFELDRHAKRLGKDVGDYNGIIEAMHPDAAAQISRKVVNLIDDRLGHMSYDNQFWNPYAKHMGQLVVMAPGWVMGTLRTITGGVADVRRLFSPEKIVGPLDKAATITDAKFGRLTSRTSNLIVLSMLTAAASGTFMYMMTGQWPSEPKDYVHPKTGRKNADGTDERIAWPTYAKEHFALATHPVKELANKLNQPLLVMVYELLHNADYTNTEIYDSHAPIGEQAKEIAGYVAASFLQPISTSNVSKADKMAELNPDTPDTNFGLKVAGLVGVTPARQELDHTDAQNFINEKYFDSFPKGTLPRSEKERFAQKAKDVSAMRRGEKVDLSAYPAAQRTLMTASSKKEADVATFTTRFKGLRRIEDKLEAWDLATKDERQRYDMRKLLLANARTQIAKISDPEQRAAVQNKVNEIRESQ